MYAYAVQPNPEADESSQRRALPFAAQSETAAKPGALEFKELLNALTLKKGVSASALASASALILAGGKASAPVEGTEARLNHLIFALSGLAEEAEWQQGFLPIHSPPMHCLRPSPFSGLHLFLPIPGPTYVRTCVNDLHTHHKKR